MSSWEGLGDLKERGDGVEAAPESSEFFTRGSSLIGAHEMGGADIAIGEKPLADVFRLRSEDNGVLRDAGRVEEADLLPRSRDRNVWPPIHDSNTVGGSPHNPHEMPI